jgi:hypothetical protein
MRIPYNKIFINIKNYNGEYFIKINTFQMEGKTGFENTNTTGEIKITEEYFERIYNAFLKINFWEIILKNRNLF